MLPSVALPPEVERKPLVQTLRWAFRPIPFMEECRRRYGDSFGVRFLGFERPMVLISDPEAIKALYGSRATACRRAATSSSSRSSAPDRC